MACQVPRTSDSRPLPHIPAKARPGASLARARRTQGEGAHCTPSEGLRPSLDQVGGPPETRFPDRDSPLSALRWRAAGHRADRGRSRRAEDSGAPGASDESARPRPCPRPGTGRALGTGLPRPCRPKSRRLTTRRRTTSISAIPRLTSSPEPERPTRRVRPSHRAPRPLHSLLLLRVAGGQGGALARRRSFPSEARSALPGSTSRASVSAMNDGLIIPIPYPQCLAQLRDAGPPDGPGDAQRHPGRRQRRLAQDFAPEGRLGAGPL